MATGRQDFSTYQHDLTPPCGLAQHVPGPLVATPGSYQYRASDAGAGVLGQRGHSIPDKTRRNYMCPHAPGSKYSSARIHCNTRLLQEQKSFLK
jgi:hypothetical protein